ncbi:XRE family transcriptional regulator [Apibacter muscae]|uniref:helix-turn-helix domain-containing protein n=1 Tax=Apibacter muscae TaxID=2509004 RepID=UPI0011ABB4BA|nr:helix-turn-helix transcriptional regulator [Apibacter muscae]TWP24626.1 XRE family transcriptional regulator [Apibacter muscae]TWP31556.1 XRE family transcriptional regulator [Apibacter muscae]
MDTAPKKVHQGRNIKRLREMLGIKQESLAIDLNITQAGVSKLENKEIIEEETLEKIAKFLNLPVEAIKNFNDETTVSFISNTFNNTHGFMYSTYTDCAFNPIEKIIELYNEKEALYERMLKEKNALLEKFLK